MVNGQDPNDVRPREPGEQQAHVQHVVLDEPLLLGGVSSIDLLPLETLDEDLVGEEHDVEVEVERAPLGQLVGQPEGRPPGEVAAEEGVLQLVRPGRVAGERQQRRQPLEDDRLQAQGRLRVLSHEPLDLRELCRLAGKPAADAAALRVVLGRLLRLSALLGLALQVEAGLVAESQRDEALKQAERRDLTGVALHDVGGRVGALHPGAAPDLQQVERHLLHERVLPRRPRRLRRRRRLLPHGHHLDDDLVQEGGDDRQGRLVHDAADEPADDGFDDAIDGVGPGDEVHHLVDDVLHGHLDGVRPGLRVLQRHVARERLDVARLQRLVLGHQQPQQVPPADVAHEDLVRLCGRLLLHPDARRLRGVDHVRREDGEVAPVRGSAVGAEGRQAGRLLQDGGPHLQAALVRGLLAERRVDVEQAGGPVAQLEGDGDEEVEAGPVVGREVEGAFQRGAGQRQAGAAAEARREQPDLEGQGRVGVVEAVRAQQEAQPGLVAAAVLPVAQAQVLQRAEQQLAADVVLGEGALRDELGGEDVAEAVDGEPVLVRGVVCEGAVVEAVGKLLGVLDGQRVLGRGGRRRLGGGLLGGGVLGRRGARLLVQGRERQHCRNFVSPLSLNCRIKRFLMFAARLVDIH